MTRTRRKFVADPNSKIEQPDRKSTRLNSSHTVKSYAVFCLKKKSPLEADFDEILATRSAEGSRSGHRPALWTLRSAMRIQSAAPQNRGQIYFSPSSWLLADE